MSVFRCHSLAVSLNVKARKKSHGTGERHGPSAIESQDRSVNRASPVKEKGLEKAQKFTKAKDCVCGGHRSARANNHRLAGYDGFLPSALGLKIGHRGQMSNGDDVKWGRPLILQILNNPFRAGS